MNYYDKLGVSEKTVKLFSESSASLSETFEKIDETALFNSAKILSAFHKENVSEANFAPTTGYGYDDLGRDALERIFADVFGAEDALVRHNIVSGTHALALCLFGILRPGDTLLCAAGKPYDSLEESISGDGVGSLKEFGVKCKVVDLLPDGTPDYNAISENCDATVKAVWIQKSKGYAWRNSLSNEIIGRIVKCVKSVREDIICIVDNCYGEFVERKEPTALGADLAAGSLIKNPGGGFVKCGGYVVGREDLIKMVASRYTAPGIDKHVGASLGHTWDMYYGLYVAPHTVAQNLKAAALCAKVMEKLGYEVHPKAEDDRYCIIQAIKLLSPEKLISFVQGIQKGSPVDAHVTPEPWGMPGYSDEIIMAAGTFVSGATSELSADGPVRPPFVAYMQGGINFETARLGLMVAVENIMK